MSRKRSKGGLVSASDQQNRDQMEALLAGALVRIRCGDTHGLAVVELQRDGIVSAIHSEMSPHSLDRLEHALSFALSIAEDTNDRQGYSN
jgi:hypothetical protein